MTSRELPQSPDSGILFVIDSLGALRRFAAGAARGTGAHAANLAVDILTEHREFDGCAVHLASGCPGTTPCGGSGLAAADGLPPWLANCLPALAETVVESGCAHLDPDLSASSPKRSGSLVILPIAASSRRLGALIAWNAQPFRFQPWHEHLLELFCDILTLSLEPGPGNAAAIVFESPPQRPAAGPSPRGAGLADDDAPDIDAADAGPPDRRNLDPLTGLLDRPAFEAQFRSMIDAAREGAQGLYLLYIDVDRYRLIRDYGGDETADRVIRIVADTLRCQVRQTSMIGRLSGDEFGIVARVDHPDAALALAQRLVQVVDALRMSYAGQRYDVSISIGLAAVGGGEKAWGLAIKQARGACRAVQRQGGGAVQCYSPGMGRRRRPEDDGRLLNQLTCALKEDRLTLFAQPIVAAQSTDDGQVAPTFFELLLRMRDKQGQIVSAGAFLPLAERYGLSVKLDRWVIREAFRLLSGSRPIVSGGADFTLNLSGHSIDDHRLLDFIIDQFSVTGLPPERVCFEITETAAISDIESAKTFIRVLKEIGCKFALDDFGSGHSSFLYLRDLEVDYLKIEGHLVREITRDPVSHAFVRSIGDIGKIMGKRTIAEHVETEAVLEAVIEIGIDFAQGYRVGRPEPLSRWLV